MPPRTTLAIFRFGKLDQVITRPGLTWILPGGDRIACFTGTQTYKLDELHVVDAAGNPIIVRALMEFAVEDPAALHIATNDSLSVLHNQAEQVVREACSRLPLLGEHGHDIRSQTHELGAAMVGGSGWVGEGGSAGAEPRRRASPCMQVRHWGSAAAAAAAGASAALHRTAPVVAPSVPTTTPVRPILLPLSSRPFPTMQMTLPQVKELNLDANSFGVTVQRMSILEARYAPEIASQMLMKQQAAAMVAARREIVAGALNVVRDTLDSFPTLSDTSRERLVTNLLCVLCSHTPASPVIAM